MGQALYRKHRPKRLSEVVGQEHITTTLTAALKSGSISHAYLFTGPRGVGKTSIARILAHEINAIPYDDDAAHLDIIEIDAASNRRIDEIRELRDKVYVAPTSSPYKVYIIDEVHMLTKEAFNALLKTLEEPPAHVVFILATTDAHKLPDTIVSRTQRYSFKPVDRAKVIAHLQQIASDEKITVSDDALGLLADHGEGSFRDSISLLDQASSAGGALELSDVQALLGIPPTEAVADLLDATANGTATAKLMTQLADLYNQGYQATAIAKQIAQLLRTQLTDNKLHIQPDAALSVLQQLIEVPTAHDPERFLEVLLLQLHNQAQPLSYTPPEAVAVTPAPAVPPTPQPAAESTPTPPGPIDEPFTSPEVSEPVTVDEPVPEKKKPATKQAKAQKVTAASSNAVTSVIDESLWPQILQALKLKHNTLYGVVRMAQPSFNDETLLLTFQFAFHQKRINEAANRQILMDILQQLTGQSIAIECLFDKTAKPAVPVVVGAVSAPPADISAISNIFGGGELLES